MLLKGDMVQSLKAILGGNFSLLILLRYQTNFFVWGTESLLELWLFYCPGILLSKDILVKIRLLILSLILA